MLAAQVPAILAPMAVHHVEVQGDHIKRLARNAPEGLIELIWNALDAEAHHVDVDVERNDLEGVASIVVRDDGLGISADRAHEAMVRLGGSWKQSTTSTPNEHRPVHGKLGEGRFKAFAVGGSIRIQSVTGDTDERQLVTVHLSLERPDEVEITGPESTQRPRGTVVTVGDVAGTLGSLTSAVQLDRYTATFAVYLTTYRDVEIRVDGQALDPRSILLGTADYQVAAPDGGRDIQLTIFEWPRDLAPLIFLCDPEGTPLGNVVSNVRSPSVYVTGYARWQAFRDNEDVLALADSHPLLQKALDAVRDQIRAHVIHREAELRRSVIEEWKAERVYPYPDEPVEGAAAVTRDIFDVVATVVAPAINSAKNRSARQLTLQLLRETLEKDPERLLFLLDSILALPNEQREALVELIEKTSFGAVIAAASMVVERLEFLRGLEQLVFDPKTSRQVLERSQLHKILEKEVWVFGEEYSVGASDRGIEKLLRVHLERLGLDYPLPASPETVVDQSGIVDLFLCRTLEVGDFRDHHLVVELKRPSITANGRDLLQIDSYALAVSEDPRFDKDNVYWDFVLVTRAMDAGAKGRARSYPGQPGQINSLRDGKVRVWVWTWAEALGRARDRMQFIQQQLDYEASEDSGRSYLERVHAGLIPILRPEGDREREL